MHTVYSTVEQTSTGSYKQLQTAAAWQQGDVASMVNNKECGEVGCQFSDLHDPDADDFQN